MAVKKTAPRQQVAKAAMTKKMREQKTRTAAASTNSMPARRAAMRNTAKTQRRY